MKGGKEVPSPESLKSNWADQGGKSVGRGSGLRFALPAVGKRALCRRGGLALGIQFSHS